MTFHDLAANRQPHSGSLILVAAMQPLKRRKYLIQVLKVESDSIIFYINIGWLRNKTFLFDFFNCNRYFANVIIVPKKVFVFFNSLE